MEYRRYFHFDHLSERLKVVGVEFSALVSSLEELQTKVTDEEQFKFGMQKLIEAKDCFVRSIL